MFKAFISLILLYFLTILRKLSTMEATSSDSVFNKMFNLEVFKLDCLDGINFTRWKDKLFFLLTKVGVAYLLSGNLPTIPEPSDKDTDEVIVARKKGNEDEVRCRGFILNALSDRLYDIFVQLNPHKKSGIPWRISIHQRNKVRINLLV